MTRRDRLRLRRYELASFTERMIGAAKLDVHVYEEVETDTGATSQAMGVVLLASLAGGIGAVGLGTGGLGSFIIGAIAALIGWVSWAFVTYIIGTRLLPEPQTRADVGELMRTLGFAQSPGLLRIFGSLPGVGPSSWVSPRFGCWLPWWLPSVRLWTTTAPSGRWVCVSWGGCLRM